MTSAQARLRKLERHHAVRRIRYVAVERLEDAELAEIGAGPDEQVFIVATGVPREADHEEAGGS